MTRHTKAQHCVPSTKAKEPSLRGGKEVGWGIKTPAPSKPVSARSLDLLEWDLDTASSSTAPAPPKPVSRRPLDLLEWSLDMEFMKQKKLKKEGHEPVSHSTMEPRPTNEMSESCSAQWSIAKVDKCMRKNGNRDDANTRPKRALPEKEMALKIKRKL